MRSRSFEASDRLVAALYYGEELDLSQMAQLRGVPQITISRRLADIRLQLQTSVSRILASAPAPRADEAASALTPPQIERCFTYAFEDWRSKIHAPAKAGVLRNLPHRRDKKPGDKESHKERDEVFAWLLANSFKRRAANAGPANVSACPGTELLSAYADRALDPEETARWELHLADCVRCRAILAACMAPEKPSAAEREVLPSTAVSKHSNLPDTNFSEIVGAAPQPPAANPRASRFVRLASRFALRWVAPIVSLAIGAAIGLALHSPNPQVTSRFPPRVAPARGDDLAVGDNSPSAESPVLPFGSPGPVTDTYDTGGGSEANGSTASAPESGWEKNRFVQLASRELLKLFTQTEKLFDFPTKLPGTVAETRAPRGRPANPSARAANSSLTRALSRQPLRNAEASPLAQALPVVFASPDGAAYWRIGPAGRIAHSADRGARWEIEESGVDADLFAGVATSDHAVWVLGRGGVILRTVDGTRWRAVANPVNVRSGERAEWIRIAAADKLHATVTATDLRKFSTSNGGATWVAAP